MTLLKYEADKNYCRETVTVASGQNLKLGTIVGMKTATDEVKIVSLDDEETDGSDVAIGVLFENVDATSGAKKSAIIARDAIVTSGCVLDADSSTLYNLYDEFEITPKVVSFALGTTTTDVKKKCMPA